MNYLKICSISLLLASVVTVAGCSTAPKSPDVNESLRKAYDVANYKQVTISQDREKGVITLGGQVTNEADKAQAEAIAKSVAGTQVVANQIAVLPVGAEGLAKKVNASLDDGIISNLNASLLQNKLQAGVKHSVKNGVVTLTGEVRSQSDRANVQELARIVPNVLQVVNELQIKDQKATSTK